MTSTKKVTLLSSDDEAFMVDVTVAMQSQTLRYMIDDDCIDNVIPLPNVTSKILSKVIEYCNKHAGPDNADEECKRWDSKFVKVDQATLFELIMASDYLNINNLLDLTCQTVANMIKGKTPEEIRKTFNMRNDYTPEEEAKIRREIQWAFE